jgi:hypothetical protein
MTKKSGGAGADALAGYEYQMDVSVWLALDLVLANKLTHECVLEPVSQEDLEADLDEFAPGRITSAVPMTGYRLIVQAKLRTGDAWTVAGVKNLLNHGTIRESAAKRLADPTVRYLLVTSAALNGRARKLRVRHAGVWPKAAEVPAMIAKSLSAGAAGRVAIVSNEDEERLASDIKTLLTESFRVPNARWDECRRALREEARIRIRGGGFGRWTRAELEDVIRKYDGYVASSPELEHYVHPTNWADLKSAMSSRHAALIIGQSGTGKTMATKKLYDELRTVVPGLARVAITLGPQQLRDDETKPPVLYDVEDPWGRFDFDPKCRPWNDQLAQFFARAAHDRMIIATSRLDVANGSGALDTVKPWLIALEAEHYGARERRMLYQTRIAALPRTLQVVAQQSEKRVLAELGTPLEIQKFFDALPTLDPLGLRNPPSFVAEAISRAHQNSIERTVIEQIERRHDVRAAAVIWALLEVSDKLSLGVLRRIEEGLAELEPHLAEGVSPLVTFFVAARNLRQTEATVAYYHPRVESGIEQTLRRHDLLTRRTLQLLIDVLMSLDGAGEDWGTAAAVRVVAATNRLPDLKPNASVEAQAKIDAWLGAKLTKPAQDFDATLQLAAAAGSARSGVSEAARFLLHRPDPAFGHMLEWGPPEHDEPWYARLRADPEIKPLLETFIREVLPTDRADFRRGKFVAEAERLATGLSEAYLAAAARALHFGVTQTSDVIAEGALKDLDGFEAIVDAAVEVLTPTEASRREAEEMHLAIVNGEYSDDYAEYLADNEEGYTANEFLEAYVHSVRIARGWHGFPVHRHREQLLHFWLRELSKDSPSSDEVAAAFAATYDGNSEDDLWHVLLRAWDPCYLPALMRRVLGGHAVRAVRLASLTCLVERAPEQLTAIGAKLVEGGRRPRLVEIAIELADLRYRRSGIGEEPRACAAEAAVVALLPVYGEVSAAAFALATNQPPALSSEARDLIGRMEGDSEELRSFRVRLDRYITLPVIDDVRWLLANTSESDIAVEAIEAAIRHGMTGEIEAALTHRFAHVVASALKAVASALPAPLPEALLALAKAKGSPVRKALVELLDAKPHQRHLPALLQLVRDQWSRSVRYLGERDDYPIARAAVPAIAKLAPLSAEAADQLYRVAIDTGDMGLRYDLFALLARSAGAPIQRLLFDLAASPGQLSVRRAAASALLAGADHAAPEIVARITPVLLATRPESVAARLLVLLAWKGELDAVMKAAEALATNEKRRVFLVLIIGMLADRDAAAANQIAGMLPANHPAVAWALGKNIGAPPENVLDNLGDPSSVAEVLLYLKPERT